VTKPTCTPLPDGNVQITGSGVISAHDASVLIVEIAKAAIQAHRRSGQTLPDRTQTEAAVPYIHPTQVGLSDGPEPDLVMLSFHFGAAEIGIPFSKFDGAGLGQALIAASADSATAH
jgi:hypothetical protein